MCCIFSSLLKFVVSTINFILMIAFLLLALVGVLLKTSKPFIEQIVKLIVSRLDEDVENIGDIADVIFDNSTTVSLVLIIVGLAVACLCLVGFIASCCGCSLLLTIYAVILGVLIAAESIATGIVFGKPEFFTGALNLLLEETLKDYASNTTSTFMWQIIMMGNKEYCCGLNGYKDFKDPSTGVLPLTFPTTCCYKKADKVLPDTCSRVDAIKARTRGCNEKINKFMMAQKNILLIIAVVVILVKAALFSLTVAAICLQSISPI